MRVPIVSSLLDKAWECGFKIMAKVLERAAS